MKKETPKARLKEISKIEENAYRAGVDMTTRNLMKHLKTYSQFTGDLRGDPAIGTVAYLGGNPFVYELFCYSWGQMVAYNAQKIEKKIHYEDIRSSSVSYARNLLAKHTVGDWLLMLDADIKFDPDLTFRMLNTLESRNVSVLTGVYLYKKEPNWPVIYTWDQKHKKYQIVKTWTTENSNLDIFEINGAGAGCLMIRKQIFQYIEQELHEEPFAIRKPFDCPKEMPLGEDMSFFDRCRQLDIQAVCDPRITVEHLMPHPITVGVDYEPHIISKT